MNKKIISFCSKFRIHLLKFQSVIYLLLLFIFFFFLPIRITTKFNKITPLKYIPELNVLFKTYRIKLFVRYRYCLKMCFPRGKNPHSIVKTNNFIHSVQLGIKNKYFFHNVLQVHILPSHMNCI